MGFIYRYMRGDEWIYVGKASKSVETRVSCHAREKKFQPYLADCKITYCEFPLSTDMDIGELALIKKYKPALNEKDKTNVTLPFVVNDSGFNWKPYIEKKTQLPKPVRKNPAVVFRGEQLSPANIEFAKENEETIKAWYDVFCDYCEYQGIEDILKSLLDCINDPELYRNRVILTSVPYPKLMSENRFCHYKELCNFSWYKNIPGEIDCSEVDEWNTENIRYLYDFVNKSMSVSQAEEISLRISIGNGDKHIDFLYDCYCSLPDTPTPTVERPRLFL